MSKKRFFYEISMAILTLIAVAIVIVDLTENLGQEQSQILLYIDNTIWGIFVIDYIVRLYLSKNKWTFIKNNKLDLIVIIPFNATFQALRIFKLSRLLKLLKIVKLLRLLALFAKFNNKISKFIKTNNFHYILVITIFIILSGTIGIMLAENMSFENALWWAFVTSTTVGYGDISPVTPAGRIIAALLMITGIGFIGMLTGTISTFFINKKATIDTSYKKEVIEGIKEKLDDFDNLSNSDIEDICKVLSSLQTSK